MGTGKRMPYRTLVSADFDPCMEGLSPLRQAGKVDYIHPRHPAAIPESLGVYDAILVQANNKLDRTLLGHAPRLKVVATTSTGTDHIDKVYLRDRGIALLSLTTEYELLDRFTATAELAWGLLLACRRQIPQQFERAKRGENNFPAGVVPPQQLSGKTLGILGYGRLGRMVAEYGKAFRMRVLACDIQAISAAGVTQVDFDTLIRESDVLSLHVHLTPETYHLIDAGVLARMKRGAVLINTARGDVVDEQALIAALQSGPLSAAGLDVIHDEWDPNLVDHPILAYARTHDNLIVTPHIGGASYESLVEARIFMAEKLAAALGALAQAQPNPAASSQGKGKK